MEDGDEDVPRKRPYFVVRGRTENRYGLDAATLVVAEVPPPPALRMDWTPDHHLFVRMCSDDPVSLSELAVTLNQPLGVVRVLCGDLLDNALVTTYSPTASPTHEVLHKVLHGLQRL